MVKLLLVHGTGDQETMDEERVACASCASTRCEQHSTSSSKWWESDGSFVAEVAAKTSSTISPESIVWTGKNLDSARGEGASLLADAILKAEKSKEGYVIVGHSHGGNIIYSALANITLDGKKLDHLKAWITVGTPFLHSYTSEKLFAGKYVRRSFFISALLLFLVLFNPLLYRSLSTHFDQSTALNAWILVLGIGGMLLLALGQHALFPYMVIRGRKTIYEEKRHRLRHIMERWCGFLHPEDEAIIGLEAAESAKIDLFRAGFGASLIRGLVVAVISLLIFIAGMVSLLMRLEVTDDESKEFIAAVGRIPGAAIFDTIYQSALENASHLLAFIGSDHPVFVVGLYVISVLIFWAVLLVLAPITRLISKAYIGSLNKIVRAAVRRQAFGSDIPDVTYQFVHTTPEQGYSHYSLPDKAQDDLVNHAKEHAAETLSKMRSVLGLNDRGAQEIEVAKFFKTFLTWNELIHTSYFKVSSSREYLVRGVAKLVDEGFKREPD
ncbi:MAG: hypothetical protein GXP06_13885 [Alphaproteobacteria bacterium]|nr:hypothetical protein [Alphaproteobacteria bacterium]